MYHWLAKCARRPAYTRTLCDIPPQPNFGLLAISFRIKREMRSVWAAVKRPPQVFVAVLSSLCTAFLSFGRTSTSDERGHASLSHNTNIAMTRSHDTATVGLFAPPLDPLQDPSATNMEECIEYVVRAELAEGGLFAHQSEHASFQIVTPKVTIRLSHGRLHQVAMRDPTDQYDLPDHLTWQMNIIIEHNEVHAINACMCSRQQQAFWLMPPTLARVVPTWRWHGAHGVPEKTL